MTRLFHHCECTVCKGWTQIANIGGVKRDICNDYVCDSCKWKAEYPEEWEKIKNARRG